jgi:hypothetical protein
MKTEDQSRLKTWKQYIEWRWWWDASSDNLSNYNAIMQRLRTKLLINTDASGKGKCLALTDEEWGRYMIWVSDAVGGHATVLTVNIDWPTWSGKTRNTDAATAIC